MAEIKKSKSPRLSHPLAGANFSTLMTVLSSNGFVRGSKIPHALLASLASVARTPFSLAERAYVAKKRREYGLSKPPVFILGHWRSGTTHLYNVMSRDPGFGYVSPFATALPWDFLLMGKALEPLLARALPSGRYIDNVPVEPTSPQEDEIGLANMTPLSYYHGLYFPKHFERNFKAGVFLDGISPKQREEWKTILRYYYDKLSIAFQGQTLLIKNPVYTARLALLREMWPDAKFIHIHRNPYKVFTSMRNFYSALFREFALQDYGHVDVDRIIFETYTRMMDAITGDSQGLADNQFIEMRFDDFQKAPLDQISALYEQLELDGFEAARPGFEAYLKSITGYKKNTYHFPEDIVEKVQKHWGPYIDRWGYAAP